MASRHGSRGATLVEFAFILPAVLLLLYGIVLYSIVLVTQQAVAYGAERGAQIAVSVDPRLDESVYLQHAEELARAEIQDVIGFLPGVMNGVQVELVEPVGSAIGQELRVTIQYPFSNWGLPTPAILPLPATMRGVGVARVLI
ncbi:hypothetical protein PC39_03337 [Salinisphaera sp. PC39]